MSKSVSSKPTYRQMICKAIVELNKRGGSSRTAIRNYIMENWAKARQNESAFAVQFRTQLKRGVEMGVFLQNGQKFRINPTLKKSMETTSRVSKATKSSRAGKRATPKTKIVQKRKLYSIQKWAVAELATCPNYSSSASELLSCLLKKHLVPKTDVSRFSSSFRGVLTRGTTNGVWELIELEGNDDPVVSLTKKTVDLVKKK